MDDRIENAFTNTENKIAEQSTSLDTVLTALEGKAAGSGDISLGLTSAAVGQTIKVKTVDTDGRPTSWEAADMGSGSGEVWEKVCDETTTEDINEWRHTSEALKAYKKLKFDFNYQISAADSDRLFFNGRNSSSFAIFGAGYSGDKFRKITGVIYPDEIKGVVVAEGGVQKQASVAISSNLQGAAAWWEQSDTVSQFPISSIGFRANTAAIVAGSRFKVWGCK